MDNDKLISLVKSYDLLYNKNSPMFKNKQKRKQAWARISKHLGFSTDVCERRWTTLRERYTKELRKLKDPSSRVAARKSPWVHFAALYFLRPHLLFRKRLNLEIDSKQEQVSPLPSPSPSSATSVLPPLSIDGDEQWPWTPGSSRVQSPKSPMDQELATVSKKEMHALDESSAEIKHDFYEINPKDIAAPSKKINDDLHEMSTKTSQPFEFHNAQMPHFAENPEDQVAVSIANVVKKCLSDMEPKKKMKTVVAIMQLLSDAECAPNE